VDDAKQGISQSDIYQMMAYGRLYGCERLMLLYPHHAALGTSEGIQSRHLIAGALQGAEHPNDQLFTASIDVATLSAMKSRLADIVMATAAAAD
jgi:5-methylcytosine-specific restriction enzyme subunit McrC